MVVHKKARTLTNLEKKNNIKKDRIFSIEVSDKKKQTIFQYVKKTRILNAEVSDKKKQRRFFSTKRSACFEGKKRDKTFYPNSKSVGCRKKSVMF